MNIPPPDAFVSALADRYRIEREIGEGGMATVYLARDLRHERPVALKVLKPELGAVLGVERFLAEIKVTANLQHPNLLPLFDSGAVDGLLYYVMPFVEGESLRARLDRERQLPVDEAVTIAASVASALDYAHRQGVIHRDLKPENILIHEGQPLVADFGIALAVSNAGGARITQTGLSLGTPHYMSPEQATGDRAIDGRTDIYSLGALTYEMLTGEAPHTGNTSQAVIARLLTERPRPVRATRASVPAQVEAAVARALEKLPADRFATAQEFADGLTGKIVVTPPQALRGTDERHGRTILERGLMAALAVVALLWAVTGVFALRPGADASAEREIVFEFDTPPTGAPLAFNVAPDGGAVLISVSDEFGTDRLAVRRLDSPEIIELRGTEGVVVGDWSPDSREIAFVSSGTLKRMDLVGGAPIAVTDVPGVHRGVAWNREGDIVVGVDGLLYRVTATGGVLTPIDLGDAAPGLRPIRFLPDGVHLLTRAVGPGTDEERGGVFVASIEGGAPVKVMESPFIVDFAAPDQLLFLRDNTLVAQTLDMRDFQLTGESVRIADDISVNSSNGNAGFAVSDNGVLVVRQAAADRGYKQMRWYGRSGDPGAAVGDSSRLAAFQLSPDGRHVLVRRTPGLETAYNLWVVDVSTGIMSPFTSREDGVGGEPIWSRDSRSVTYTVSDSVFVRRLGGTTDSLLAVSSGTLRDYSPDGGSLLMAGFRELTVFPMGRSGTPVQVGTAVTQHNHRISPDGLSVAYHTNEMGPYQVWVASFPTLENRRQVSADGGTHPRWRADGEELFFLDDDGHVMAVAVEPGPIPEFGVPAPLFRGPAPPAFFASQFSVTGDGQRFLLAVGPGYAADRAPLRVVVNWTRALNGPAR